VALVGLDKAWYIVIGFNLLPIRKTMKRYKSTRIFHLCTIAATIILTFFSGCGGGSYTDPLVGEMVYVRGGTFTMGCTSEQQNECDADENPAHQVKLGDFYICKYEVTQAQWKAVMGEDNNPSWFKGDNLPMESVSWNDAQAFIGRLNEKTGMNYRLPTEAEWEYAARGGNRSRGYKYSGSNTAGDVAWYEDNSEGTTHPVGIKLANELGIHDMSGNVWEWVNDWYGNYAADLKTDPQGLSWGSYRVYRGGSWIFFARDVRVSARHNISPGMGLRTVGFRLARSSK